ncbi:biotin/lipoyl-containing protein [Kiritimatiella glycovorans]|uniref:Oxaloacetate decarboxylase, alpha subunit n=1 Tax=Kiritimatiella glycovorans TaxID=1307763 RepID=A0A0G3EIU4_9BACT|nr:biotin/lipoyl-containing protein [Kiritimatiella glycovorans]AKJ64089.1 Oxaloacetate decarboxylase, alpha subunit [Kiritimatiella glycovorans]
MGKKKIEIMITAFRDGFQSIYGARVFTKDFLPAVEATRDAGIRHFEAGGGARFQSLFFYCNENAFDMMDAFRETAGPDADLQTLARGNNVVGLESQSSDVIDLHARMFKKHGITTIRNFDALNDVNNLKYSGRCIHEAGLKHEVVVSMMELPPGCEGAHTPDFYMRVLREILEAEIPYASVCFKDASGTSTPAKVYETIRRARKELPEGTKLVFHTHDTAGTGVMCYKAALDGGADQLDLSMAPVSGGTGQPDVLSMWHALRGSEFEFDIDVEKLRKAEEVFKDCMKDYFTPPEAKSVEPTIPFSPMPGGALTANTQMLRDNHLMDRYPEIIAAMGEVVRRGGFGTSVTPVSQFYFQQAFNNVMMGPWKKIADGYGKMVLGYFGRTPVDPDPEIVKLASEQLGLEPTDKTVIELNDADPDKGLEPARAMLKAAGLPETEENLFIAAACKQKGIAYLKGEAKTNVRKQTARSAKSMDDAEGYTVDVDGRTYSVVIEGTQAVVNGKSYKFDIRDGVQVEGTAPGGKESAATGDAQPVKAQMPGTVNKIAVQVGDPVSEGDLLAVLEAMKMETEVKSPVKGTVSSIAVKAGDSVAAGNVLLWVN